MKRMTMLAAGAAAATAMMPAAASAQIEQYMGDVILVGYNFCPIGWAEANGQLLAVAEYDALYSLIGTTYGGDGRTTFAVPDLRGRIPVGVGQGPGLSPIVIGEKIRYALGYALPAQSGGPHPRCAWHVPDRRHGQSGERHPGDLQSAALPPEWRGRDDGSRHGVTGGRRHAGGRSRPDPGSALLHRHGRHLPATQLTSHVGLLQTPPAVSAGGVLRLGLRHQWRAGVSRAVSDQSSPCRPD